MTSPLISSLGGPRCGELADADITERVVRSERDYDGPMYHVYRRVPAPWASAADGEHVLVYLGLFGPKKPAE
jgi:hypothetical protein